MRFFLCILLLFLCSLLFVMSSNLYAAGFTGMSFAEEQALTDLHGRSGKTAAFIRNSGLSKLDMGFKQTAPINTKLPATLVRPVSYTPAALRNLIKLKSLTPSGIALTAAITAAGYLIDEYGDISNVQPDVTYQEGFYWNSFYYASHATPALAAQGYVTIFKEQNPSSSPISLGYTVNSSTQITTRLKNTVNNQEFTTTFTRQSCAQAGNIPACPSTAPVTPQPLNDDDFINDLAPELDWDDIPYDGSGNPIPTPEHTDTLTQINNWYTTNYVDNTQTSTSTSTSTTITNPDGSETTTGSTESEIPAFCNWAGIVCDAIIWLQEPFSSPTDIALPTEELVIPSYTSGLSDNGICPAPYDAIVFGSTIPVSYQPFCDLASLIRPLVLAAAGLIAGFVLVRARG